MLHATLGPAGILVATTIGAGIFGLPYVFLTAGWGTGIFYLVALSVALAIAHVLYLRVLVAFDAHVRLLGLSRRYFGEGGFRVAFLAIVGGLLLALVAYLILAGEFLSLLIPALSRETAIFLFWVAGSLPMVLSVRRFARAELVGAFAMALIIVFVFVAADRPLALFSADRAVPQQFFLPFGVLLFALAGWTAIEPMYDFSRAREGKPGRLTGAIWWGTAFIAVLYLLFVMGIAGSSDAVTPDTISGLSGWAPWRVGLLAILGLFAIWTSYLPVSVEIKNALKGDLGWPRAASYLVPVLIPIFCVAIGLTDFLRVIGFAGGVFLGIEYVLIILVASKALALRGAAALGAHALAFLFALGAIYEVYYFVLQ